MEDPKNKVTWSIKVHPGLREWFEEYAELRKTSPQEEARRALADFREREETKDIDKRGS